MEIRKMAMALPLAFGIACSTSHANRTAKTEGPPAAGSTATAQSGTYGTPGSSTAAGSSDIKGHDSDQVLMGKVADVSSSSLSIQSDMGDSRTLQVVPETIVTVDGRDGHLSDIQQGQEVRASFNEQEGKQVAVRIEAGRAAGDMGAGTTGTGTGTPTDMGAPGSSTSGSSSTSDTGTSSGSTGTSGTGTGGGYDTSGTR